MENDKSSVLTLVVVLFLLFGMVAGVIGALRMIPDGSDKESDSQKESATVGNGSEEAESNLLGTVGTPNYSNTQEGLGENMRFFNHYERDTGRNYLAIEINELTYGKTYKLSWKLDPNFRAADGDPYIETKSFDGIVCPVFTIGTKDDGYLGSYLRAKDGKVSTMYEGSWEFKMERKEEPAEFFILRFDETDPDRSYEIYQGLKQYVVYCHVEEIGG